jgi:hypothetical protein
VLTSGTLSAVTVCRPRRQKVSGHLHNVICSPAHQLTVVHYDADFETAATVLTFRHTWVLPRGSVYPNLQQRLFDG